ATEQSADILAKLTELGVQPEDGEVVISTHCDLDHVVHHEHFINAEHIVHREKYEVAVSVFFFSSRRRHTRSDRDWSSDVCSSDLALIDVEDLYDEFTFGAKSPWALRAFLQQAHSHWARPPRFLLLAGDASVDPRNFMGMGETDVVPTKLVDTKYLETASDDWFGDLDDDGVPEIAVGRLAVQTSEQAAAVVQKLIGYDRAGAGGHTAVLVADHDDGIDFEGASAQVKALLPADA